VRRHLRALVLGAVALIVIATAITGFGFVFLRPLPTVDGDVRLIGLHERAEILRDKFGVPHVFAADRHDLFYLQGYVTAQDRLWQMDIYRRAAAGRLSEVLGDPGLESDRTLRTIGLARAAALDLGVASPEVKEILQAYADGVNKFIEQHGDSLPFEFLLLGYKPEPWSSLDTATIAKLQLWDAAGNYTQELLRASIADRLGLEVLATLMPDPGPTVAYDADAWQQVAVDLGGGSPRAVAADALLGGGALDGLGSNCWAIAGSRTKSGKPLLAGDPHLPVRNPSIWYEVALTNPDIALTGFSIPGVPGVVIGHNDTIAWSFTYAEADTQDLFVEHQDPTDLHRYEYKGAFEPATFVRETIKVKGRTDPVIVDVAVTRHGPIITPVLQGQKAQVALRWSALDAGKTLDAVLAMNSARSFDAFRRAASDFTGATLNACYADTAGHVGYLLVGRLPDRPGDGRIPVPGWTGAFDWRGLLPADANLAVLDPSDGLIVNANQRPAALTPSTAGYLGEWDPGFRYAYLRSVLDPMKGADVAAMSRVQNDYTSLPVQRYRDAIVAGRPTTALGQQLQKIVREWDGSLAVDSAGAAIYESWILQMSKQVYSDKLGGTLFDDYATNGRMTFSLYQLVASTTSPWMVSLGDPSLAGRDALSGAALDAAGKELTTKLGGDIAKWRWGDLHTIAWEHPLSAAKPLDLILTIGPVRRAGDGYSANNGAFSLTKPYAVRTQPSERQIVDLGDIDASVSIIPTGQSGQPYSPHWGDQTQLWANGGTKRMALGKDHIGELEGRLILRPR
jgi:penicillin amidase